MTLQKALVAAADREREVVLPGYTHMQRAQPVLAAHYFLAYVEKFQRDRDRLADCRKRLNILPLGAAALAGTSLPIDRDSVRRQLGFDAIAANSLDVSSDRDFLLEYVFALSVIALHLAGWAEEWMLWSTTEFGFLVLPDAFCTGSSIMPHKKNPDVLELIRGKSARVAAALHQLMLLVKGLPLAYNRDLQEDKEPLFDANDTVDACLELAAALIDRTRLEPRPHRGPPGRRLPRCDDVDGILHRQGRADAHRPRSRRQASPPLRRAANAGWPTCLRLHLMKCNPASARR